MKRLLLLITIYISSVSFGQYTSIPDPNFEQALIDLGHDDFIDGQVLTSSLSGLDSLILDGNYLITNLDGIQDFLDLQTLIYNDGDLTTLDLSNNINLKTIRLSDNSLSSININGLNSIDTLVLTSNQLTSIQLNTNSSIEYLSLGFNLFNNIDLSGNPNITYLDCQGNQLVTLDLTNNLLLKDLFCGNNLISSLNLNQLTNVEWVFCQSNELTTLDISLNQSLVNLNAANNNLNSLNINGCSSLEILTLDNNQIEELNCSGTPQLKQLTLYGNDLNCLNIQNGNNSNWYLLTVQNNPNLTCIQVDDVSWASSNLNSWLDPQQTFSVDCSNACSDSFVGIGELNSNQPKELIKIVNLLGQEVEYTPNTVLIYQYSDGTSEKIFTIED